MKAFLYSIIFTIASACMYGQFYPLEAGVAGGISPGINFRAYLDENLSYEALLSFRNEGFQVHLIRQQHNELKMTEEGNFYLLYGYGAHTGFYYTDHYSFFFRDIYFGRDVFTPVLGVDGFAALEFRFVELPMSIALNYKPFMELSLRQFFGLNLWDFGLTVKYRFRPDNKYY